MNIKDIFLRMSYKEASMHLEHYQQKMDEGIALGTDAADIPEGSVGKLWRTIYGQPRSVSPVELYLGDIVREQQAALQEKNKELASQKRKATVARKQASESISGISELQSEKKELQEELERIFNDMPSNPDETIAALRESILVLSKKCRENGIKVEAHELPHIMHKLSLD